MFRPNILASGGDATTSLPKRQRRERTSGSGAATTTSDVSTHTEREHSAAAAETPLKVKNQPSKATSDAIDAAVSARSLRKKAEGSIAGKDGVSSDNYECTCFVGDSVCRNQSLAIQWDLYANM